jgi:outer membrane protein OmpA-like peptidoglycan-associated protein
MTNFERLTCLSITLVLATTPATAQRARQVEFGGFGSFTRFDRTLRVDNTIGFGGRFGYFVSDVFSLEFEGLYQSPSPTDAAPKPKTLFGGVSIVANFGGPSNLFYLLGGVTRTDYTSSGRLDFSENGLHGAIGDRIFLGPQLALRVEARGIYIPSPVNWNSWRGQVVGTVGLSLFTGAGRILDIDFDGIADGKDTCPGTPRGATVDPRGCPADSDADQVFNGLDNCPNTPGGATVDAQGCPQDGDKDAVYDGIDKCPTTPTGATVNAEGCVQDGDGDGSPDGLDQCPNTPAGATVDANGCPQDGDSDGVFDGLDKCPGTARGTEVTADGCARSRDTDGDGVDDARDRCPGTAAGTRVDAAGCPILFTPERTPVILRGVTFETGRSSLRTESFTVLDLVAQSLNGNPDIRIEIAGFTDSVGSIRTNTRLSQARAEAVRVYLASKGVNPSRMVARGYGPAAPVAPNNTAEGRALNRRVELRQIQ